MSMASTCAQARRGQRPAVPAIPPGLRRVARHSATNPRGFTMRKTNRILRRAALFQALAFVGWAASPVHAQTPTSEAPATAEPATTLDAIVVTSRKREENIMEVPMNITAISDQEIRDRGLSNVQDIYRTISGGATATGELILRGLSGGNSPSPGTTSTFVDGVPFNFGNLFDVERIEVLRGPQGTLYGSNAIGGTVRVITRQPQMNEFEVFTTLRGTWEKNVDGTATRAEAGVNIPLVQDTLAMRVAASVNHTPLAIRNAHTGTQSTRDGEFLRTQLAWEPSDLMRFNFGYIFVENRAVGTNRADRSQPGFRRFATFTENPDSPWGYDVSYENVPCPPAAERPECYSGGPVVDSNPKYTIFELMDGWSKTQTNLYSLAFDHDDLGGIASMHYVGSYRKNFGTSLDNWSRLDMDDMMRTWIINRDSTKRITHELRFQNIERRGGVDWTAGVFQDRTWGGYRPDIQWQYHEADPRSIALFSDWNDWAWAFYDWEGLWGVRNIAELGEALYGDPTKNYNLTRLHSKDDEQAAFGEGSYRFQTGAGDFELTAGIRYFRLEDSSHTLSSGIWIGPEGNESISEGKESGNRKKLGIAYMPNPDMNIYAVYSEGYRPGGNNFPELPNACVGDEFANQFSPRYNSDQIDNYELGLKANLFDRRFRMAAAVYNIDWTDVRTSIYMPSCGFTYIANAADARSRGIEFESSTFIGNGTMLTFNASYTDSKMLSDVEALGARRGDSMTMVPKYNAYIALDREFSLFGRNTYARIDMAAYGKYKSHFNVRDEDSSPAYRTVNLSGRMDLNGNTSLGIHLNNVFNEEYYTYRAARSRTSSRLPLHEIYGAERSLTLRLDYRFD